MTDLVGPGEIASRLGVKRATVSQWRARGLLPTPIAVLAGADSQRSVPVWYWPAVEEWAVKSKRL